MPSRAQGATTGMSRLRSAAERLWPLGLPVVLAVVFLIVDVAGLGSVATTVAGFAVGLLASVAIEQQLARMRLEESSGDLSELARGVAEQSVVLESLSRLGRLPSAQREQAESWLATYVRAVQNAEAEVETLMHVLEVRVSQEVVWLDRLTHRKADLGTPSPKFLLGLTAASKRSLAAVAYGEHATAWWSSDVGATYLKANVAACQRGVTVRRLFVEGAFSSATTRQMWIERVREQLSSPLQVGYLTSDDGALAPNESGEDTAIFDARYLFRSTELGRAGRSSYLSGDPSEIRLGLEDFERLWFKCERNSSAINARLDELSAQVMTVVAKTQSDDFQALLDDPKFLREAFVRGMPPAFVKRPGAGPVHIIESEALTRFQRKAMGTARWAEDEVTQDHSQADTRVLEQGNDRQLELATPSATGTNHLVLTTKSLIHHNGEAYVVGWYLPAVVQDGATSMELSWIEAVIDYPPVRCAPAPRYQGVRVHVGDTAVRRNFVD